MYTIPHFYNFKNINQSLMSFEKDMRHNTNPTIQPNIYNYTNLLESIAVTIKDVMKDLFLKYIEKIDHDFKTMPNRVDNYYVKDTRERTIITPYGEITFSRTIYQSRHNGSCYTHVDRFLGLPKYDRFDPALKSMIVELYADQNSMIKVGKIIGNQIYSNFSIDEARYYHAIPRQTVFNIVSKAKIYKPTPKKQKRVPKTLYIMADEKYIGTQGNDGAKVMTKAAVAFEGMSYKGKRMEYTNKFYHLAITQDFWSEFYNILHDRYELDDIEKIYIMGDGAPWIKNGVNEFKRNEVVFALDRFHLEQSLTRMTRDKDIRKIISSYIYENDRKEFNEFSKSIFKEAKEERKETVQKEIKYIKNNWDAIQIMNKEIIIGCGMEGTISHTLASIFTSVPKGYKIENLKVYLNSRTLYLNDYDLRRVYLKSYDKEEKIVTDLKPLNYSIFDERASIDKATTSNFIKSTFWRN